jgi:Icc protein
MLIGQITDIHLGFEPDNPEEANRQRLDRVLSELIGGRNRPELMLATGDLVDRGDLDSYRRVAEALRQCPFPVYPCMGNHDDRANFASVFPQVPIVSGFVQYCIALEGLRIIILDTLEVGRHGGGFCEIRAAWLKARLAEHRDTPTMIVMHHPPLDTGIDWMDPRPDQPWIGRFTAAISGHRQIQAIWCGHLHRTIVAPWNGITVSVCPATAAELSLDLNPIDPDQPDDRPMVNNDPPGYALHRWTRHGMVSHFDAVQEHVVLAKFDDRMQGLVRDLLEERRH